MSFAKWLTGLLWISSVYSQVLGSDLSGSISRQGKKFTHFVLPRVLTEPSGGEYPFVNHPLLSENRLPEGVFSQNASQIDFFERNRGLNNFSSINPSGLGMYDSMSQSENRILVMLTGVLWQQAAVDSVSDIVTLARHYNNETLNQERLEAAAKEWFQNKITTGHRYPQLRRFLAERNPNLGQALKGREFREFENLHVGASYFLPSNQFGMILDLIQILSQRAFKTHVSFVFLQSGGHMSDPKEFMKDTGDLIPFVYDEQGEVSMEYIDRRVPTMTLVDREGTIMYQGNPLPLMRLKTTIDRLLIPVYEKVGADLAKANHDRRVKAVEDARERELSRRRELARQAEQKKNRGDAFKNRQSDDPGVNQINVKDLSFY
ncbi:MAG: hypothetical protein H3C47_01365 [Candidatus Cloacimonetes bacterium]|nr:hypothetical protein [Candidatus Cloacimonadota bacterium]